MPAKKGPLTVGETNALVAMVTGCEPEQVAGWLVIAAVNGHCPTHGMSQQVATSTNLKLGAHVRMLAKALEQAGEEIEDNETS